MRSAVARLAKRSLGPENWKRLARQLKSLDAVIVQSPLEGFVQWVITDVASQIKGDVGGKASGIIVFAVALLLMKDVYLHGLAIGWIPFLVDISPFGAWELFNIFQDWKDLRTANYLEGLVGNRHTWQHSQLRELIQRPEMEFFSNHLAIGSNMILCHSTDIAQGWNSSDIKFRLSGQTYIAPFHDTPEFRQHLVDVENHPRQENKKRVMLETCPEVGSDRDVLVLKCLRTDWATFRFPRVQTNWETTRSNVAEEYFQFDKTFPNSLTLQLIVKTLDKLYVLGNVSKFNTGDLPGWALSLGEQIDPSEISDHDDPIRDCAVRALREEYGITSTSNNLSPIAGDLHVMALNFEYIPCNFTLIAIAELTWTFNELNASFKGVDRPTKDREFSAIKSIDARDLKSLLTDDVANHFSTPIRAAMAMIFEGEIGNVLKVLKTKAEKTPDHNNFNPKSFDTATV